MRARLAVRTALALGAACAGLHFSGCVSPEALRVESARRSEELNFMLARMRGRPKKDFIRKFGKPSNCAPTPSGGEICEFYRDMGLETFAPSHASRSGVRDRIKTSAYERARVEFDPGGAAVLGEAFVHY